MSKVIAVFPGCGKTKLVTDCFCKDVLNRVKFVDADYHYFKRMFGGDIAQSNKRVDNAYLAFLKCVKKIEKKALIFINHIRGLEDLIDEIIIPSFSVDVAEMRFKHRRANGKLELGELDIINHFERYKRDWESYANRYDITTNYMKEDEFLENMESIRPYVEEFYRFKSTMLKEDTL